jgi:uncharacterized protein (TIGR03546 family)
MIFLIVCLFRVNLSMFFLSSAVFSIVAFILDPLLDGFGYWILADVEAFRSAWVWVASQPLLPYMKLNNTIVMGSLALGLLLFVPVFIASIVLIKKYRAKWRAQMRDSKTLKAMRASKVFGILFSSFEKYQNLQEKWNKIA